MEIFVTANRNRSVSTQLSVTLCMLGDFACFFLSIFFFKINFSKILSGIPSVSYSLDPDQARHFVGPDLDPNCLQQMTKVTTSSQRVNKK